MQYPRIHEHERHERAGPARRAQHTHQWKSSKSRGASAYQAEDDAEAAVWTDNSPSEVPHASPDEEEWGQDCVLDHTGAGDDDEDVAAFMNELLGEHDVEQ